MFKLLLIHFERISRICFCSTFRRYFFKDYAKDMFCIYQVQSEQEKIVKKSHSILFSRENLKDPFICIKLKKFTEKEKIKDGCAHNYCVIVL